MKKFSHKDINTRAYFDKFFKDKVIDEENLLRQNLYLRTIEAEYPQAQRIVELGAGISPFCGMAAKKYDDVWAVDFSPVAMEKIRDAYPLVHTVVSDATQTAFMDKYFDVVVAGELLEHLAEPKKLIKEMKRLAKHLIVLSTPQLEFRDPEHLWEFTPSDVKKLLGKNSQIIVAESEKFKGRKYILAWLRL